MKKSAVVFVLLSLAITLSAPAFGQKKKAKILFDKGVAALQKKSYKTALDAFEEAYEISPHWAVLAHIGTCHANLDHPIKAIEALQQYMEDGGANIPDDEKETARNIITRQRRKVGVLLLSVERQDVEALVDGESIGTSPFDEKLLKPGPHEVAVVFDEDDIVKRNFEIGPGQEYLLRIEQEQHLATSPPPPPVIKQEVEPEASAADAEKEMPAPSFSEPPSADESTQSGSLVPFFVSLGFTISSAAVAGVGWGFYAHYKMSESNFEDYLSAIKAAGERFENYTWEETCGSETKPPGEAADHYCDTERKMRDFSDSADKWFIVGIAGSAATVVSGALTIVFYKLRHRFGDDSSESSSFSLAPHFNATEQGLQLSIRF